MGGIGPDTFGETLPESCRTALIGAQVQTVPGRNGRRVREESGHGMTVAGGTAE